MSRSLAFEYAHKYSHSLKPEAFRQVIEVLAEVRGLLQIYAKEHETALRLLER
jgi:hypothetical protein